MTETNLNSPISPQLREVTEELLAAPVLVGSMRESQDYRYMGLGLTDRVFILGHNGSCELELNDPIQVTSMQNIVNELEADTQLPLLRSVMHTYGAGCRDIFVMRVAPGIEYVDSQQDRLLPSSSVNKSYAEIYEFDSSYTIPEGITIQEWDSYTFYERYYARLEVAYRILLEWDLPQIVVPLEAPFYDAGGVDFVTQLADHCDEAFANTGAVRIGFLGSKTTDAKISSEDIEAIKADTRFQDNTLGSKGKYVAAFLGECTFQTQEIASVYTASPIHVLAGMISTMPLNFGLTYKQIPNAVNLVGANMSNSDIANLAMLKINTIVRTQLGKRGQRFQIVSATDNTLAGVSASSLQRFYGESPLVLTAPTGDERSAFWSVLNTRTIMLIIEQIRSIGRKFIGEIGFGQFKQEVQQLMVGLTAKDMIRDFSLRIYRPTLSAYDLREDLFTAIVEVEVRPYCGVRSVTFMTEVGPQL